jgi:hypothetical protein
VKPIRRCRPRLRARTGLRGPRRAPPPTRGRAPRRVRRVGLDVLTRSAAFPTHGNRSAGSELTASPGSLGDVRFLAESGDVVEDQATP